MTNLTETKTRPAHAHWRYPVASIGLVLVAIAVLNVQLFANDYEVLACASGRPPRCGLASVVGWTPWVLAAIASFGTYLMYRWANRSITSSIGVAITVWVASVGVLAALFEPYRLGSPFPELFLVAAWGTLGLALIRSGIEAATSGAQRTANLVTAGLWCAFMAVVFKAIA